jgi:hypothetical protein
MIASRRHTGSPTWPAPLKSQPSAAVVYCRVVAVPHDTKAGYVPAYEPAKTGW